ncbi:MAG: hypothetical protein EOO38_26055, partial [Cytophagaceae bacterium]
RTHLLYNGPLRCTLVHLAVPSPTPMAAKSLAQQNRQALHNRLLKNMQKVGGWAKRQGIGCYRLYDRDLPQNNVAIDVFDDRDIVVHEFAAPKTVDKTRSEARLRDVLDILGETHPHIDASHVHLKVRQRQRGASQYERLDAAQNFVQVAEGPHRFWVNYTDFVDVGLFLDHRQVRRRLAAQAAGKSFLNLFANSCNMSVSAGFNFSGSSTFLGDGGVVLFCGSCALSAFALAPTLCCLCSFHNFSRQLFV